ncbi:MAG: hypothetical protein F4X36_09845 [Gammaproteobacteria bacterium]|nr:hypothetical protein [Gammaproteobacteria bacterium]
MHLFTDSFQYWIAFGSFPTIGFGVLMSALQLPKPEPTNRMVRRPRSITATDVEWERVKKRARAAHLPVARYLIERALDPVADADAGPPAWLRTVRRDVALLTLVEQWRVESHADAETWERLVERAEMILAADDQLTADE